MSEAAAARPEHVALDRVIDFDIYDPPGAKQDFHLAWRRLQSSTPLELLWTPRNGGHWIALRKKVLAEILEDHGRFANTASILPKDAYGEFGLLPVTLDPPAHRPYRMLLNAGLSPAAIRNTEPFIRETARGLIDGFVADGACEFISQYSHQFPVRIFLRMAELPLEDAPKLKSWSDQMLRPEPGTDWGEDVSGWRRGIRLFREYLEPHVEERRRLKSTDLLGKIINGDIAGRPVNHEEALQLTVQLVLAGLDTVVNFLGFSMLHLARSPRQQQELVNAPELIPDAVEELLRRFGIVTMAREVRDDLVFHGVQLRKGDMIATPTMLGGLDDTVNACPMDVDFHRTGREHVTFGNGAHTCPGAFLARNEIRITLEEWMRRIPRFGLAPDHQVSHTPGGVAVVDSLPLRWRSDS